MRLLLCPSVTPFDPPEKIREWLEELARTRERFAGDKESLATIARAEDAARCWPDAVPLGSTRTDSFSRVRPVFGGATELRLL